MVVIFCFLRFTPFTPSRWISFLALTFSSIARAVRYVPGTGYRDNHVLSFIHSKQWKQFVPRECSINSSKYARATTARMKPNGLHPARWNSHSGFDGDSGILVHDAVLTDSYRRFGDASCLHFQQSKQSKRSPDHSTWQTTWIFRKHRQRSVFLSRSLNGKTIFPKSESILQRNRPITEIQRAEIFPSHIDSVPYRYCSSDPRECKGFPLKTVFRYAHVPNKTGCHCINLLTPSVSCTYHQV